MNLNLSEKLKTGLTPQEKIDCYETAIKHFLEEKRRSGICYSLDMQFNDSYKYAGYAHQETLFPEFYSLKPKNATMYWFNSTEERIQVLNKLIEEQKKLL